MCLQMGSDGGLPDEVLSLQPCLPSLGPPPGRGASPRTRTATLGLRARGRVCSAVLAGQAGCDHSLNTRHGHCHLSRLRWRPRTGLNGCADTWFPPGTWFSHHIARMGTDSCDTTACPRPSPATFYLPTEREPPVRPPGPVPGPCQPHSGPEGPAL